MIILAACFGIIAVACWIIILSDAFRNTQWKGWAALFAWPYTLYYSAVEFKHPAKWPVAFGWLIGSVVSASNVYMLSSPPH
jgi:hypothetical protein